MSASTEKQKKFGGGRKGFHRTRRYIVSRRYGGMGATGEAMRMLQQSLIY